tara:strand:- start:859 stop:1056 length:198 start_codon:yes stop_codon:yes gene_type:complete
MSQKTIDLLTRAAWTAVQVVLGAITVEAFDLDVAFVPVVAAALSAAKSFVATQVGNPDTVTFDVK